MTRTNLHKHCGSPGDHSYIAVARMAAVDMGDTPA